MEVEVEEEGGGRREERRARSEEGGESRSRVMKNTLIVVVKCKGILRYLCDPICVRDRCVYKSINRHVTLSDLKIPHRNLNQYLVERPHSRESQNRFG